MDPFTFFSAHSIRADLETAKQAIETAQTAGSPTQVDAAVAEGTKTALDAIGKVVKVLGSGLIDR